MKPLIYLVTVAALAVTAAAATTGRLAERDQPKKDYVEKSLDPRMPGADGALVTTVRYG
jgi:hypothetical protein